MDKYFSNRTDQNVKKRKLKIVEIEKDKLGNIVSIIADIEQVNLNEDPNGTKIDATTFSAILEK